MEVGGAQRTDPATVPLDAVVSWTLPLFGAGYFVVRPRLWIKAICPILISLVATVVSLVLLFTFALQPQERYLEQGSGWPAWLSWPAAILMVLAEVAIVNIIILLVLFGGVQSQILRIVLEERGVLEKVRRERGLDALPEANCCRDVGHNLLFLLARLPLMLLTLPLHALPVLGQIAWVSLNGWLYTWELEAEVMVMFEDLHRCEEQYSYVKKRFGSFFGFGAVAMSLELVPFVGPWIFFASNACGAAFLAEIFWERKFD